MSIFDLIKSLPDADALETLRQRPDLLRLDVINALCDQVIAMGFHHPHDALAIAELAVDLVGRLPRFWPFREIEATRARVLSACGGGHRLLERFERAEAALTVAYRHARSIVSDPPIELLDIYFQFTSLRLDQRRHREAGQMAARAVEIARADADPESLGRALTMKGVVSYYSVELSAARRETKEALCLLPQGSVWHSAALQTYGAALGESEGSVCDSELDRVLDEFNAVERGGLKGAFFSWTEGLILRKRGCYETGRQQLRVATSRFRKYTIPAHFAVATIDLATIDILEGDRDSAKSSVIAALSVLEAFSLSKEQQTAALILAKAAEQDVDLELLRLSRDRFLGRLAS